MHTFSLHCIGHDTMRLVLYHSSTDTVRKQMADRALSCLSSDSITVHVILIHTNAHSYQIARQATHSLADTVRIS